MSELRWNPLLGTWTMVASNRQARPHLPQGWCPFCPGSGRVPDDYDVFAYDNDFPVLKTRPDPSAGPGNDPLYRVMENYGKCEVILYSPDHRATLHSLPLPHLVRLVELWVERCRELSRDPRIRYVFPFENRGEEVGVTMPHPHGQLYAYPFVPLKLQVELENSRGWHRRTGGCLMCGINDRERNDGRRIIAGNDSFLAYLPWFTDYPYGVFVASRRHLSRLDELDPPERLDLARMLKGVTGAFDTLFDRPFPYMMCVHQAPVNSPEWDGAGGFFHLHIEFYPPLRERDKIKWYASSEMGAWAAANVAAVEETAPRLREAWSRFESRSADPPLFHSVPEGE